MSSLFHISERNHLGMILMSELAERHDASGFTRLTDIAKNMKMPLGYLEEIAFTLKKAGLIEGRQGPQGGYRLTELPQKITAEKILTALEGPLALVACQNTATPCPVEHKCVSRSLWGRLQKNILVTLRQTTLADL
ncbi:MAG: Rrf2 family transcriptional regulator [Candidatus Uhrbacteria bacterium]|nr:Rrf2 family transcriptional regulator [Candidatus Uhrbacteria bacterium]MDP3793667.1 Rrf2 family transcriptional regulator [Candidatus Uhrbacteria bacterium]